MELKKKVRRHIEELTRLAYERGYRDGAQSALAEIEKIAGEDRAKLLKEAPASLEALAKRTIPDVPRSAALKRRQVQQRHLHQRIARFVAHATKVAARQRIVQLVGKERPPYVGELIEARAPEVHPVELGEQQRGTQGEIEEHRGQAAHRHGRHQHAAEHA